MKKHLFVLVTFFLVTSSAYAAQEAPRNLLAQELTSMLENDPDVKMRMEIEDERIASFFDWVEKSKVIAQQESGLAHAFDYFFFNIFPGSAFQEVFKGLVYVSPEKAPRINAIVQELCTKYEMPVPPIFLAGDQKLFNAFASSFSTNRAMVVLGKKIVDYLNDDELTAVLAHELAHVKHNHVPKMLALTGLMLAGIGTGYYVYAKVCAPGAQKNADVQHAQEMVDAWDRAAKAGLWKKQMIAFAAYFGFLLLMIKVCAEVSRMHEKEADLDAIKITQNPKAFVAAMERLKEFYEKELEKTRQQSECLDKKIEELALVSPGVAAYIKSHADAYINAKIEKLQDAITEENGSHPSMETRIAYGKQACEQPVVLQ